MLKVSCFGNTNLSVLRPKVLEHALEVALLTVSKERDKRWKVLIAIFRQLAGTRVLILACNTKHADVRPGKDSECERDDVTYKSENPFLPDDRVVMTLAVTPDD